MSSLCKQYTILTCLIFRIWCLNFKKHKVDVKHEVDQQQHNCWVTAWFYDENGVFSLLHNDVFIIGRREGECNLSLCYSISDGYL